LKRFEYLEKRNARISEAKAFHENFCELNPNMKKISEDLFQEKKALIILDIPVLNDELTLMQKRVEDYKEREKQRNIIREKRSRSAREVFDEYIKEKANPSEKSLLNQLVKYGIITFTINVRKENGEEISEDLTVDEFLKFYSDYQQHEKNIAEHILAPFSAPWLPAGWDNQTKKKAHSALMRFIQFLKENKKRIFKGECIWKYRNPRPTSIPLSLHYLSEIFLSLEKEASERDEILIKLIFYLGEALPIQKILHLKIEDLGNFSSFLSAEFFARIKSYIKRRRKGLIFLTAKGKPIQASQIKRILKISAKKTSVNRAVSLETLKNSLSYLNFIRI